MLSNKGRHNTTKLGPNAVQELKINQRRILIDSLEIGIPAPKQMIALGERQLPNGVKVGQLLNSKTLNYKKFTPHRDGLFCERIFGPVQSFICACGKKKESVHGKKRQKNMLTSTSTEGIGETTGAQKQALFCPKCQVEYISKDVRRHRLGYIKLFAPVTHIWYLKGRPSYLSLFLGKRKKAMTSLAYCNAFLVEQVYSDLRLETENVLKNVDKLTTDLLEKGNIKRGERSHTSNFYKKQALYKFDKADSFSSENSFFNLLVKLFPETNRQGYAFTNLMSFSIKEKSIDKQKQKIKQLGKKRKLNKKNLTKAPPLQTLFEPEHSSGNLHKQQDEVLLFVQAKTNKVNASKFFQNNDAFTESSYMRAQTLPFLPSLISPFHLRDCLISFLQSLPCKEDVPIPFYCQTVRRYPLRDVHKFITEFRSREGTKKAERLTSESIARLIGLAKDGKLPITSYSKKTRTKNSLVNLKENFGTFKEAKKKQIENARPVLVKLWYANILDAHVKSSIAQTKTKFLRTKAKIWYPLCRLPKLRFCMPFGLINIFTRFKMTTVALPKINNLNNNSIILEQNRVVLRSLLNKRKVKLTHFFSLKAKKETVKLLPSLFNSPFKNEPNCVNNPLFYLPYSSKVIPKRSAQDKALFSTVFCSKQEALLGYRGNKKFTYLHLPILLYALPVSCCLQSNNKQSKALLPLCRLKACFHFNTEQKSIFKIKWHMLASQKRSSACKREVLPFCTGKNFPFASMTGDAKVLQSLQSIKPFEQSERPSNLLSNVQTINSKKTWSGYFAQPKIDYQSNLQNVSKNLFNNNLLSFSIKKDTQTYQARLLYVVFGAGKQDIKSHQLTQPKSYSLCNLNRGCKNEVVQKGSTSFLQATTEWSKKQVFLNKTNTFLYSTVFLPEDSIDINNRTKKKLNFSSAHKAKHDTISFMFETIQQERKVILSSRPLHSFTQSLKLGGILTASLSINLPFFISGSKQNKVFFIIKKEKKVEWGVDKTCVKLLEPVVAQLQTLPTFNLNRGYKSEAVQKRSSSLLQGTTDRLQKRSCAKRKYFLFASIPCTDNKKTFVFLSNAPESAMSETDQPFLTCLSNKTHSFKKSSDFISRCFPDVTVFNCTLMIHFKISEQRTFNLNRGCKNEVVQKGSTSFLQALASCAKTNYFVFASKIRRYESDKKIEQKISIKGIQNLIKNSSDRVFTKMRLEQRHANLLATRSCSIFLGRSVLNRHRGNKPILFSSSKTLQVTPDQMKSFTDTDKVLSKDSQTSFGSEMISKWHLNGAKEILLYTGGGALESLLKRFNISLFYEFLFGEIQILRKHYKNQMFFIADYNKKKTLEKQSPAETKQSFVVQKHSFCKQKRSSARWHCSGDREPSNAKASQCLQKGSTPFLHNEIYAALAKAKLLHNKTSFCFGTAPLLQDSFGPNNINQAKTKNTYFDLSPRSSHQKACFPAKQQIFSRLGPENSYNNSQGGKESVPKLRATTVMQIFRQSSVFNAYERRSLFVKAAIEAEIPNSFDIGKKQKKARLYKNGASLNKDLLSSYTNKTYALPVFNLDHQGRDFKVNFKEKSLQKPSSARQSTAKMKLCKNEVLRFCKHSQQSKAFLTVEKSTNSFCRRIYRTTRRLKIVQLLMRSQRRPEWMMISILPVLPPDLRPLLQMGENLIVASDLNTLYQRVIYRNNRHYKGRFLDFHFVSSIQRLVQDAVDRLIENGKGGSTPFLTPGGRPLKSLSDILKGKRGRFRFNLLGKRVDFSGRSVIVVSPNLKIHECGLPREMALELYKYLLIRQLLITKRVSSIVNAKKVIKQRKPFIWDMLRDIIYYHPLLLNRAPTLHRLGIQAFQPKLTLGNAILLHPLVCAGFNADFDGDQMGVHLPLSPQARAEAWDLLWSRNNLLSPATGQPILLPSQDMVLGFYYMTALLPSGTTFTPRNEELQINTKKKLNSASYFLDKDNSIASSENKNLTYAFSDTSQIVHAYQKKQIDIHTPIWLKWSSKFENGEKYQIPLELRLDSFGSKTQIYPTYKYKSDICKDKNTFSLTFKKNNVVTIHIRTTVGRVLVNNLIS